MATGLGASNIAPSDESAWTTYAVPGNNEVRQEASLRTKSPSHS